MLLDEQVPSVKPVVVIPVGDEFEAEAFRVTQRLRLAGIAADIGFSGNLSRRMKRANRMGAAYAVILGSDELARDAATLRDMETGAQEEVALDKLVDRLTQRR